MKMFNVVRHTDTVVVYIMRNKSDDTYSFVNITKGHICSCRFKTEEDAIKDMIRLKKEGAILDFIELSKEE